MEGIKFQFNPEVYHRVQLLTISSVWNCKLCPQNFFKHYIGILILCEEHWVLDFTELFGSGVDIAADVIMEVDEFLFYSQFMLFPSQESPISEEEKAPPPIKRIDDAKFDKISGIVSTICYILNNTQVTVKERRIIDISILIYMCNWAYIWTEIMFT